MSKLWEAIDWEKVIDEGLKLAKKWQLWEKLMEALEKKRRILLLGASGAGKTQFCESIIDPRALPVDYLAANKIEEFNLLREWVPLVDAGACPWVLTVVTKADLWWPDRTKVMKHYDAGKYAKGLAHLKSIHSVLPYCGTIRPFLGGRTSGEFGDEQREALRGRLFDFLRRKAGDRD